MIAPAAIAAAVEDALAPLGVRVDEVPLTPERIANLVEAARAARKTTTA
jgi:carbon-monoxide dehydrogenase large subunit